jgi:hypothetical protein
LISILDHGHRAWIANRHVIVLLRHVVNLLIATALLLPVAPARSLALALNAGNILPSLYMVRLYSVRQYIVRL